MIFGRLKDKDLNEDTSDCPAVEDAAWTPVHSHVKSSVVLYVIARLKLSQAHDARAWLAPSQ